MTVFCHNYLCRGIVIKSAGDDAPEASPNLSALGALVLLAGIPVGKASVPHAFFIVCGNGKRDPGDQLLRAACGAARPEFCTPMKYSGGIVISRRTMFWNSGLTR